MVILSIRRPVQGLLSRVVFLLQQHAVTTNAAPPLLECRGLASSTVSSWVKPNVGHVQGQSQVFGSRLAPIQVRHFGATLEVCALEAPEESEWDKKVDFLLNCGLSKDQAAKVLRQCPLLVAMSLEDELELKVEFLKALGVRDLAKVIVFYPPLLLCRIEMNLMPKVAFFESLGIQRQSIGKIIERYPTVLTYSIEGNMRSKTRFLESIGLDKESIAKVIMRSPYIFALSIEDNMRPKVELLESIGVDKKFMTKLISKCPKIFCLSNEDNVLPKIKYLESVGVEKHCMGKIVAHCPSILNLSTSLIQEKLDFLKANQYSVKKVVNEFPVYLTYSLEKRIKPRHRLISSLKEKGLLKRDYSLSYILQMSERQFLKDFVAGHSEPYITDGCP